MSTKAKATTAAATAAAAAAQQVIVVVKCTPFIKATFCAMKWMYTEISPLSAVNNQLFFADTFSTFHRINYARF